MMKRVQVKLPRTIECRDDYWHSKRALKKWTLPYELNRNNMRCKPPETQRIQKIQASASREQAAAVAGMEDHITAMGLRDSTRDELNRDVAREQYRQIRCHDDNSGVSARLHLRLCLCRNLRVCICICAACICVGASVCNAHIDQCNDIHNALACTPRS